MADKLTLPFANPNNLQAPLGFKAQAVEIDNLTNQDVYVVDADRYVAPGVTGAVITLDRVTVANIQFQIPPGITRPAPVAGQLVRATFYPLDWPAVAPAPGVANTPSLSGSVSITGAVTLGAGAAVIGAISAVNSIVSVGGTVSIGNTPAVTISGTPAVTINSGVVNITGNVTIINASGTNLQVAQSQVKLGATIAGTVQFTVDPRWHALGIIATAGGVTTLSVKGHTTGVQYVPLALQAFTAVAGQRFVIPLTPLSSDDTLLDVLASGTNMQVIAILDAGATSEAYTGSGQILNAGGDRNVAANAAGSIGGRQVNVDLPPNGNTKGLCMWVQVVGGVGTSVVTIQANDPNTSSAISILATSALGAGQGSFMRVYPGLTPAANAVASDVLGQTPRIQVVFGANTQATNLSLTVDRM